MSQQSVLSEYNREKFSKRVFDITEPRIRKALEMLAPEPRSRALDVAAGSGYIAEVIAGDGWQVSAVELSTELAAQIRERGISDVHVHDLASGPLPFEDETFGAVFAGEIIEHLIDTDGFLNEIARVLVPSGVVVITTPNLASFENRARLALGRYPRWLEYRLLHGEGHVRAYTPRTLRYQLAERGFRIEEMKGNWVPLLPQRWVNDVKYPALARTGDWLPSLSQGLICKARKLPASGSGARAG